MPRITDYHLESRISNESYKLELAVRALAELGVGRDGIVEIVDDKIESMEDEETRGGTMSTIRAYLEEKAALPNREWIDREPRETHPEILELVREFHAAGGSYDDDAERFVEEHAGDLPEHHHHGHDERDRLTYQLGHEVYIAKGILRDEELAAELAASLEAGYRPIEAVEIEEGKRYTVRRGTTYAGQTVPSFTNPSEVRAVRHGDGFAFMPKRSSVNGFTLSAPALVREGWDS